MIARRLAPGLLPLLLMSHPLVAQEASVTLHTTVSGNQEQPKVMYILPWQQPGEVKFSQEFSSGLAGDLFVSQDRDEFIRQLHYQEMLDAAQSSAPNEENDALQETE